MKNYWKVCLLGLLTMGLLASCKKPEKENPTPNPASDMNFTATCNGTTIVSGGTIEVRKTSVYGDELTAHFLVTAKANIDFSMKFEEVQPEDVLEMFSICGFGGCRSGNSIDNEKLESGKTYGGDPDDIHIAYVVGEDVVKATTKVTLSDNTNGKEVSFTLVFDPTRD